MGASDLKIKADIFENDKEADNSVCQIIERLDDEPHLNSINPLPNPKIPQT